MTTSEAIPEALLRRYKATLAKDAALRELVALKAAQEAAEEASRLARLSMHRFAANDPRLRGATYEERGVAMKVSVSRAANICQENRDK